MTLQNTIADHETTARYLYESYSTPHSEKSIVRLLNEYSHVDINCYEGEKTARRLLNNYILRYYPNEMTIKSSFVNSIILKQSQNAISIFELPVGNSRVDFCKVNGHSCAYEIKTDLDTFSRLEKQLEDYFSIFEKVYVITSDQRSGSLPDYVPDACGIYSYHQKRDGHYVFHLQRAPRLNRDLDPVKQLSIIPKKNLCTNFGIDTIYDKRTVIEQCLSKKAPSYINHFFKQYLKCRYGNKWGFFKTNQSLICEIDYEWFYRNNISPTLFY